MTALAAPSWYVVQTQPRSETKACFNLRRQGYTTYLPQYLKPRRHARRTDRVPAPLFPRYLFVRIDPACPRWMPIRSTIGVTDIVRRGNQPAPLADAIVQEIHRRENESGFVVLKPACAFRPGDRVHVIGGAFADRTGLFECATDDERVVLLLDLLGRAVRVELALEDISAFA